MTTNLIIVAMRRGAMNVERRENAQFQNLYMRAMVWAVESYGKSGTIILYVDCTAFLR